jgi:hypothetical protein
VSGRASFRSPASVASIGSISSTNSSIFDRPLSGPETPLTPPEAKGGRDRRLSSKVYGNIEEQQDVKALEKTLEELKRQDGKGNDGLRKEFVDSPLAQKRPGVNWTVQQNGRRDSPCSILLDGDDDADRDECRIFPRPKKRPLLQRHKKDAALAVLRINSTGFPSDNEEVIDLTAYRLAFRW